MLSSVQGCGGRDEGEGVGGGGGRVEGGKGGKGKGVGKKEGTGEERPKTRPNIPKLGSDSSLKLNADSNFPNLGTQLFLTFPPVRIQAPGKGIRLPKNTTPIAF